MQDELLVRAVTEDDTVVLGKLLQRGDYVNAKNEDGYPVLMFAIAAQKTLEVS